MPIRDTKICPDISEELIFSAETTDEHIRGRDTLELILPHTPPHYIRHLNYGTKESKNWNRLIKTAQETTSIDERTSSLHMARNSIGSNHNIKLTTLHTVVDITTQKMPMSDRIHHLQTSAIFIYL